MKKIIPISFVSALVLVGQLSHAAILAVSNIGDLTTDRLYAYQDGSRMNGGLVTIGYFNSGAIDPTTIANLFSNLGNFITVSTFVPGSPMTSLGGMAINGYADNTGDTPGAIGGSVPASIGQLLTGNALIGRSYFSIITNASSLGSATLSSQYALVKLGQLPNEDGGELSFNSNPKSIAPVIGTIGSFTGDLGFGSNTYSTLKMTSVPEPSAALLGAVGMIGLLRRRRI